MHWSNRGNKVVYVEDSGDWIDEIKIVRDSDNLFDVYFWKNSVFLDLNNLKRIVEAFYAL